MAFTINNHETRWDFDEAIEPKIHRIHAYPAKFPAFITKKAVEVARSNGIEVNTIADVFCGCGTTAFEARKLGLNYWGRDINPVATLIAQVKSSNYDVDTLKNLYKMVLARYRITRKKVSVRGLPERLNHWYSAQHKRELKALLESIMAVVKDERCQKFFLVAFSNILKPVSKWLTKSIKPQVDPNKHPETALAAFKKQFAFMVKAIESTPIQEIHECDIETENLLECNVDKPFADIVVTSPPYVTSYEYADLHQLSTLWLGYVTDYRELRKGTIGSMYDDPDVEQESLVLNDSGLRMVKRLRKVEPRKAAASARYFADMKRTVDKCKQILRPGGMVFFVIGDTEYKGVKIKNSIYLAQCLEDAGFIDVRMDKRQVTGKILTPYRNKEGRFSKSSNSAMKIYAEEYVLMGRKANVAA